MKVRRRTTGAESGSGWAGAALSLGVVLFSGCTDPLGLGQSNGGNVAPVENALRLEPRRAAGGLPCVSPPQMGWTLFEARIFELGSSPTVEAPAEPRFVVGRQPCLRAIVVDAVAGRYYGVEMDGFDALGVLRWRFACGVGGGTPTLAAQGRSVPVDGCERLTLPLTPGPDAAAPLPSLGAGLSDAGLPDSGSLADAALGDAGVGDAGAEEAGIVEQPDAAIAADAAASVQTVLTDAEVQALQSVPACSHPVRGDVGWACKPNSRPNGAPAAGPEGRSP